MYTAAESVLHAVCATHCTLAALVLHCWRYWYCWRTYTLSSCLSLYLLCHRLMPLLFGCAGKEPTIVSPKQYMRRFRTAISSYFTVVPDGRDMEPPLDPDTP